MKQLAITIVLILTGAACGCRDEVASQEKGTRPEDRPVRIDIARPDEWQVALMPVTKEKTAEIFESTLRRHPDVQVVVAVWKGVEPNCLAELLDVLRRIGITEVKVVFDAEPPQVRLPGFPGSDSAANKGMQADG